MKYREIIKKIQHDSGFSDTESAEALERTVESIAERLQEGERMDFASQLPAELQQVALDATITKEMHKKDILEEFMEKENIEAEHAKKQFLSAWSALRSFISEGEIRHIKSQLPQRAADMLY
jgi:uncharacterized protein (DUF2267 family)